MTHEMTVQSTKPLLGVTFSAVDNLVNKSV